MKVLPIKFPDEQYAYLKKAAEIEKTSMADLVRKFSFGPIKKIVSKKKSRDSSISDLFKNIEYQGEWHHPDKTDDELLYSAWIWKLF